MPHGRPLQPGDPERLGIYEITGRLWECGYGVLFLGTGPVGRVAVKLLRVRLTGESLERSRFVRELAPVRRITSSTVAALLDVGVSGDRPYLVSEFVNGPSLQDFIRTEGARGPRTIRRLALGTAVAIATVHRAGIVHRTIKPASVLLAPEGPHLTDFGLARSLDVAAPAAALPTDSPAYMAPEQLSGVGDGPAADVFAWASTLLFAASGQPPFGDGSVPAVMERIVYERPDLAPLDPAMRGLVSDALIKDPARRPSAAALVDRLLADPAVLAEMPDALIAEARALTLEETPPRPAPPPPVPLDLPPPATSPAIPTAAFPTEPISAEPGGAPRPAGRRRAGRLTPVPPVAAAGPGPLAGAEPVIPGGPARPASAEPVVPAGADEFAAFAEPGGLAEENGTMVQALPPWADEPDPYLAGGAPGGAGPVAEPATAPPAKRPRDHHAIGILASLAVGVLAGIVIILLVLWPQLKNDPSGTAPVARSSIAPDDRPVSSIPRTFAGTWRGTAINQRENASFQVEVTFRAGQTSTAVRYPTLGCTGTLTLVRGTRLRLELTLEVTKPCTNGAITVTKQSDGTLRYVWRRPGTQFTYEAILSNG